MEQQASDTCSGGYSTEDEVPARLLCREAECERRRVAAQAEAEAAFALQDDFACVEAKRPKFALNEWKMLFMQVVGGKSVLRMVEILIALFERLHLCAPLSLQLRLTVEFVQLRTLLTDEPLIDIAYRKCKHALPNEFLEIYANFVCAVSGSPRRAKAPAWDVKAVRRAVRRIREMLDRSSECSVLRSNRFADACWQLHVHLASKSARKEVEALFHSMRARHAWLNEPVAASYTYGAKSTVFMCVRGAWPWSSVSAPAHVVRQLLSREPVLRRAAATALHESLVKVPLHTNAAAKRFVSAVSAGKPAACTAFVFEALTGVPDERVICAPTTGQAFANWCTQADVDGLKTRVADSNFGRFALDWTPDGTATGLALAYGAFMQPHLGPKRFTSLSSALRRRVAFLALQASGARDDARVRVALRHDVFLSFDGDGFLLKLGDVAIKARPPLSLVGALLGASRDEEELVAPESHGLCVPDDPWAAFVTHLLAFPPGFLCGPFMVAKSYIFDTRTGVAVERDLHNKSSMYNEGAAVVRLTNRWYRMPKGEAGIACGAPVQLQSVYAGYVTLYVGFVALLRKLPVASVAELFAAPEEVHVQPCLTCRENSFSHPYLVAYEAPMFDAIPCVDTLEDALPAALVGAAHLCCRARHAWETVSGQPACLSVADVLCFVRAALTAAVPRMNKRKRLAGGRARATAFWSEPRAKAMVCDLLARLHKTFMLTTGCGAEPVVSGPFLDTTLCYRATEGVEPAQVYIVDGTGDTETTRLRTRTILQHAGAWALVVATPLMAAKTVRSVLGAAHVLTIGEHRGKQGRNKGGSNGSFAVCVYVGELQ